MTRLAGKGRFYTLAIVDHEGKVTPHTFPFPSVTSILDAVVAKPKLMHWYYSMAMQGTAELVKKYGGKLPPDAAAIKQLMGANGLSPYKKRDTAATRGTNVHADMEKLAAGETVEVTAQNAGLCNWFSDRGITPDDVIACEIPLVSFKHRYAGTVDLVYKDPETGRVRLTDLKTGNTIQWTHFVQSEAYAEAWREQGGWVDEVTILHAPPMPEDKFLAAANVANGSKPNRGWDEKLSPEVNFDAFRAILEIYNALPVDWLPEDAE